MNKVETNQFWNTIFNFQLREIEREKVAYYPTGFGIVNNKLMHPESSHFARTWKPFYYIQQYISSNSNVLATNHSYIYYLILHNRKKLLGKKHDGKVKTSNSRTGHVYIFQIESAEKKFEYIKLDVKQVGDSSYRKLFLK